MRINIYSQELPVELESKAVQFGAKTSDTGRSYFFIRLFLHSSDRLHHTIQDDDRSAITFWLPKSEDKRAMLAAWFRRMAEKIDGAPPETE